MKGKHKLVLVPALLVDLNLIEFGNQTKNSIEFDSTVIAKTQWSESIAFSGVPLGSEIELTHKLLIDRFQCHAMKK